MKKNYSRLARKEYKENLHKTILYLMLTVLLIFGLLFLGIPALIKMAVFLGNLKSTYSPVENVDGFAPAAPKFKPTFEATNSAQINLEGFAEPEAMVEIFLNGNSREKTSADTEGQFSLNFELSSGNNEVYAIASGKNNQRSASSESLMINFDNTPPEITTLEPQENAHLYLPTGKTQIRGEVNEEAMVTVNDRQVILDNNRQFSLPVTLSDGENKFKIVAIDLAGNQTEKEFTVTRE